MTVSWQWGVTNVLPTSWNMRPILCADDFAISPGVSAGIEELAAVGHLSAASAIVTLPTWSREGKRVAPLRKKIAVGLHVNLTLGAPIDSMPDLAPSGTFPSLKSLLIRCFAGRPPNPREIALEVERQVSRFEDAAGYAPDFVDGHQHVHILPGIREGFIAALLARFPDERPLVRNPSDSFASIVGRRGALIKALNVAALATGFGAAVRRAGFVTNEGFSGFSNFSTAVDYAGEFETFFHHTGRRHLIMCHPGYPDAELETLDPLVDRRRDELRFLLAAAGLADRIWRMGDRQEDHRAGAGTCAVKDRRIPTVERMM